LRCNKFGARSKGYDAISLRRGRLETGPTKAFKALFVNDLWMTTLFPTKYFDANLTKQFGVLHAAESRFESPVP
jgi:hypothetical protein